MFGIRRREFIALLGSGAAVWPLAVRAQQPAMPVAGFLFAGAPEGNLGPVMAIRRALSEMGFIENRNVAVEFRWTYNDRAKALENANDLVNRGVQVIFASTAAQA